jgi:cytochrome b561
MSELTQTNAQNPTIIFDKGYKWLHWSMAFLMMLMLFALVAFSQPMTTEESMAMLTGHSSIGTIITVLMLVRVTKRFVKRDPRPEQDITRWQQMASKTVQLSLYFCMIFIPLTGYLTARFHELPVMAFGSFNLNSGHDEAAFELLRSIHAFGIRLFMVLLVLHIGAVFYHRLIKKDGVLASMTRSRK